MVLHQRHTHGRVFKGSEARDLLALRKRYFNNDMVRMHVPEGWEASQKQVEDAGASDPTADPGVVEAVSVVYVTLPQTFSGAAIYSTLSDYTPDATEAPASATPSANPQATYDAAKSSARHGHTTATDVATATVIPTSSIPQTTLQTATASRIAGTPLQATHTPSSTSSPEQSEGGGMTDGAKAGLAFGTIIVICLAVGLVLFCLKRRKAQRNEGQMLDEKHGGLADPAAHRAEAGGLGAAGVGTGAAAALARRSSTQTEKVPASLRSVRTASTAPRLSLRPVTQFLPNLADRRKSAGNTRDVAGAPGETRPSAGQNPFDDATVLSEKQAQPDSPPTNPFDEPDVKRTSGGSNGTAAAGVAAAWKHSPKPSCEGNEPATPRNAEFGTAAAVPVGSGATGPRQPNNVHRVQLDFKPSMDDELELQSGQLVRMLHEYDDGWALCIRMDRSQQGVAPRTCLSKLPVKPRPQGSPPPSASPRGPPPGARGPGSNGSPPNSMVPRPLTPTQSSASPSATSKSEASTTPAGIPARKPVPGQAM